MAVECADMGRTLQAEANGLVAHDGPRLWRVTFRSSPADDGHQARRARDVQFASSEAGPNVRKFHPELTVSDG